jgi:sugar lactone lactonase YvrE
MLRTIFMPLRRPAFLLSSLSETKSERPPMRRRLRSNDRTATVCALGGIACLAAISLPRAGLAEQLFHPERLSPLLNEYTTRIEGPAVSPDGDLYVVNIKIPRTAHPDTDGGGIGRVKKGTTKSEPFTTLPPGGIGNGIRFDLQGRMYVADYKKHIVHVFDAGSTTAQTYFEALPNHDGKPAFTQPNDLAIARDGTLYASDPNKDTGTGQVWQITRGSDGKGVGKPMTSTRPMGKANGIDLSPDNKTLYVSESTFHARHASIWSYRIDGTALVDPVAVKTFTDGHDVDGLRVDTDGRIFVARPETREVVILVPQGAVGTAPAPVKTLGQNPNNLTFGGVDGRDVYVTQGEANNRFIERFRTDRPGREPCLLTPAPEGCRAIP